MPPIKSPSYGALSPKQQDFRRSTCICKTRQRPPKRPKILATLATLGRLMGGKTVSPKKEAEIHFCSVLRRAELANSISLQPPGNPSLFEQYHKTPPFPLLGLLKPRTLDSSIAKVFNTVPNCSSAECSSSTSPKPRLEIPESTRDVGRVSTDIKLHHQIRR